MINRNKIILLMITIFIFNSCSKNVVAPITDLKISNNPGNGNYILTWTNPIFEDFDLTEISHNGVILDESKNTSLELQNLENESFHNYSFRVRNKNGKYSLTEKYELKVEYDFTPPSEVTYLNYVVADRSIITWVNPKSADFDKIEIYNSGTKIGVTQAESFTIKNIEKYNIPIFIIKAIDISGNISNGVSIELDTVENRKSVLNNSNYGENEISIIRYREIENNIILYWEPLNEDIKEVEIYNVSNGKTELLETIILDQDIGYSRFSYFKNQATLKKTLEHNDLNFLVKAITQDDVIKSEYNLSVTPKLLTLDLIPVVSGINEIDVYWDYILQDGDQLSLFYNNSSVVYSGKENNLKLKKLKYDTQYQISGELTTTLGKKIKSNIKTLRTSKIDVFNTLWKLNSANEEISFRAYSEKGSKLKINWGDGETTIIEGGLEPNQSHTYSRQGIYNISIEGIIRGWNTHNWPSQMRSKLLEVSSWGNFKFSTESHHFNGCNNLIITAEDIPLFDDRVSFYESFYRCYSLVDIPNIEMWPIKNISSIDSMLSQVKIEEDKIKNIYAIFGQYLE